MILLCALLLGANHQATDLQIYQQFDYDAGGPRLEISSQSHSIQPWSLNGSLVKFTYRRSDPNADGVLELASGANMVSAVPRPPIQSTVNIRLYFRETQDVASWYTVTSDLSRAVTRDNQGWTGAAQPETTSFYVPGAERDWSGLRQRWIGRKVWTLGAAAYTGPFPTRHLEAEREIWSPSEPAVITAIEPAPFSWGSTRCAPEWDEDWGTNGFWCMRPIVVRLALPKMEKHRDPGGADDFGPTLYPSMPGVPQESFSYPEVPNRPGERTGWIIVADEWELPRVLTLTSPKKALDQSTSTVRRAFARRQVIPGMARELVARLIGYPDLIKSPADYWKDKQWSYGAPAPFSYQVSFNSKNLVTKASMDGSLP